VKRRCVCFLLMLSKIHYVIVLFCVLIVAIAVVGIAATVVTARVTLKPEHSRIITQSFSLFLINNTHITHSYICILQILSTNFSFCKIETVVLFLIE
jgi:hypothetical protein